MRLCKACQMEIDNKATKCPHCQAYQQWYKNPQHYGLFFVFPFILFIFWQSSMFKSEQFTQYQSQFTIEEVTETVSDDDKRVIITYRIKNGTKHKWEHLSYELIGKDRNNNLVMTDAGSEYSWVVQPGGETYLTVKVEKNKNVYSWNIRITDLETSRF